MSKYTLSDCQQLATERNGKCLSTKYNHTKLKWQCSEGHVWEASFSNVKNNKTWCLQCANIKRKILRNDIKWCCKLAKDKGGKCLSDQYCGTKIKLKWQCKEGHVWESKPNAIQQGKWCPTCGRGTFNIEYCDKFVESQYSGKCLSIFYKNVHSLLTWRCSKGHIWNSTFHNVKINNEWCPYCSKRTSKIEVKLREFLQKYFIDLQFNKRGLLQQHRFEFDIYIPSLRKAIEFDGDYWHASEEAQIRDELKNQQCKDAGIDLLRIKECDYRNNCYLVHQKCLDFLQCSNVI